MKANPSNPVHDVILNPKYENLYEIRPKEIKPIGLRMKPAIESAGLHLDKIKEKRISPVPPWTLRQPKVLFDLNRNKMAIRLHFNLNQNLMS